MNNSFLTLLSGEHSDAKGGIYDISNKRRLGRSEADLVRDMYEGVKAMIAAEKQLWSVLQSTQIIFSSVFNF